MHKISKFIKPKGMTLLEIMLVLAVASAITIMSIRTYISYRNRVEVDQVRLNIGTLFQAMTNYYRAQCGNSLDNMGAVVAGTIASANTTKPFPITFAQLQKYLPQNWEIKNPLIESYILQFNPTIMPQPINTNACVVQTVGTPCVSTSTAIPNNQAQVIIWNMQVAVKPANLDNITVLKLQLRGRCTSNLSTDIVDVCPPSPPASDSGSYIVFTQLPSMFSKTSSSLWASKLQLKEFKLQYTHDQMYELTPGSKDNSLSTMRNYMCGS